MPHTDKAPTTPASRPVASVTGGLRGLGLAIARQMAQDGFDIAVIDLSPPGPACDAVLLPRGSAQNLRGSLALRAITLAEPWARRRLSLCVRAQESLSGAAGLLVAHLRAQIAEATP